MDQNTISINYNQEFEMNMNISIISHDKDIIDFYNEQIILNYYPSFFF